MSMADPFLPHPHRDETIAAADPGPGGPAPAEGFGIGGEDPDVAAGQEREQAGPATGPADATADGQDPPFRTPDPDDVRRAP